MMGFRILGLLTFATLVLAQAGCSSNTAKQIGAFADKVCACKDAACAEAVQAEYLAWWKENRRSRGSGGDKKDVEKLMQRYSECHAKLVGPAPSAPPVAIPKVDLTPPAPPATAPSEADPAVAPSPSPSEPAPTPEAEKANAAEESNP